MTEIFNDCAERQLSQLLYAVLFFHASEYLLAIACHGKSKVTIESLLISKNYIKTHEKKIWEAAIKELIDKITVLKQDHYKLSREAHECVDSVPDLENMVYAVQAFVVMCEDLKMKYSEEQVNLMLQKSHFLP
ncbi:hypothetical protein L2E82_30297 [Cichorium intybus]|uniref:Uncharacterized protein n=1 Tax=Cichorium intybus TaxID=13427 RepID=A0ACB9D072_CICIN|nr:hypothetical protein L2E82_30297 [Cichorium intybus]